MNAILIILAFLGLLLVIIGRILMLHHASQISVWWVIALRVLPLAELMFLARYWEEAKSGAFTSLIGLALIMPLGGKMLWDMQHAKPDGKSQSFAMRGSELMRMVREAEREERIQGQQRRIEAMNARLKGWYDAMQQRRAALSTDAAAVASFNAEAAAYHEFLTVAREQADDLMKLRAKKVE